MDPATQVILTIISLCLTTAGIVISFFALGMGRENARRALERDRPYLKVAPGIAWSPEMGSQLSVTVGNAGLVTVTIINAGFFLSKKDGLGRSISFTDSEGGRLPLKLEPFSQIVLKSGPVTHDNPDLKEMFESYAEIGGGKIFKGDALTFDVAEHIRKLPGPNPQMQSRVHPSPRGTQF